MKERLQELINSYRELCDELDSINVKTLLDDFEDLVKQFPDVKPAKFYQYRQNN